MGQPSSSSAQPSGQKPLHAPPFSSAWAHTPPFVNLTAHPIRFYASSPVQPSHPSGHLPPHASPIAVGQKPSKLSSLYSSTSLYSSANLYSSTNLSVDPLQQPFFYRNRADQHHNRLGIEAGESSAPSGYGQPYVRGLRINQTYRRAVFEVSNSLAQIDIPMYSKNPVISLPNVFSNYITNSVAFSAQSLTHDNGNQFSFVSIARNNDIPRETASTSQPIGPTASQTSSPTLRSIAQSGATDHLTGFSEHFVTYTPCVGNEEIWIADCSLAPIAGQGQIVLYDGFSLQNVLHVPKLSYNLLSISKITRELHYKATFLLESVCFQDLNLGRTIGTARHSRGLYILNDDSFEVPLRVFGCTTYVHSFGPNQTKFTPRAQACVFVGYLPHQRGESVSEESNSTFEFIEPIPSTVFDIDPHPIILPTNQVPWKTYYRRNFRKEVGSPTSQPSAPVQDFEPPRDQGMENPTEPCTNNTMSENDRSDAAVLENMEEKNFGDEIDVRIETSNDEAKQGHTRKHDEYDPSLDLPIALRKGTRSCTKHPISNYVSYENLSPQFRAFTASLDSTTIPKNIYIALECPEWKNVLMEEMKALEKNNTWEICALPKGHKLVGCKWVFTLKYKEDGTLDRHKARLVAKRFTQTYGVDYSETFSPVAKLNTVRLLSVAVNKDWSLYQLDVKNAFLNGDLVEEVYMSHPPGFEAQCGQQVCKLQKSLYGLKQSPRAWLDRFTTFVKFQGYSQGHSDHTLFSNVSETGKIAVLIVYVDDIVLSGDDQAEISQLKQRMGNEFEIKDLENLKYFLGMEVAISKEGISVSQRKYTLNLLTETGILGCRLADTPIEFNCKLGNSDDQVPVDKEQYQRLVGKLIYLSHTRPDIYFAVSAVSQFMQAPYEEQMEVVKRILRYLKTAPGKGKSTSGYCTFVWGNLVTWRSKKQNVVARSNAEVEYRAMSLGISAISIANNPIQHDRTKHVEIDRHFIKERLDSGNICIPYIPSSRQVVDVLTKGLLIPNFDFCVSKLGLIDIYVPT
ncbi:Beta-galactosidase [Cucumis melo var. makuwa]|uniref:Beta-galactosidase n=1 Tax=Cucumis melo var. makuwa TaxID=1194695 RepID=A0A5A7TBP7_CUCMM|nr:Beta-galactosidase [Cucumis melo var. makuwa]